MTRNALIFPMMLAICMAQPAVAEVSCDLETGFAQQKPLGSPEAGTYQLQQALVRYDLPDGQVVTIHFLKTPDSQVVGAINCPTGIEDTGANMKVLTESVIETLILEDEHLVIPNETRLWDLVLLAIDDELHLQQVRMPELSLKRENLSTNALEDIEGLRFFRTGAGMIVRYLNVALLYKKI